MKKYLMYAALGYGIWWAIKKSKEAKAADAVVDGTTEAVAATVATNGYYLI